MGLDPHLLVPVSVSFQPRHFSIRRDGVLAFTVGIIQGEAGASANTIQNQGVGIDCVFHSGNLYQRRCDRASNHWVQILA